MLLISSLEVFLTWAIIALALIGLGSIILTLFSEDYSLIDDFWMGLAQDNRTSKPGKHEHARGEQRGSQVTSEGRAAELQTILIYPMPTLPPTQRIRHRILLQSHRVSCWARSVE